jgi:hypothetical protein
VVEQSARVIEDLKELRAGFPDTFFGFAKEREPLAGKEDINKTKLFGLRQTAHFA